ncbi:hypothetical protein C8R46DRAFT_1286089 [Mycena filopes]|nr:hypothetical protein C8R46DRAFT_1286089 [Mycena filopes]
MPPFPTPPPTQSTSAVDWFSSLPPDERTTLLNALNAGGEEGDLMFPRTSTSTYRSPAGSSSLSGSDAGQHLPQLETFSGDNAPLYTDGDDGDGDNDQDSSWGRRPNDGWGQPSDDGPADEQSTPTSSLDITMRTVNPAYRRAHKRKRHADPADDEPSEDEQDEDDDSEEMQRPKKKSRSIAGRPEEHQRICECAFDKIKIELALRKPFPVSVGRSRTARARTDEFMELILEAWTDAAFDLELEHVKPTKDDIDLIRARVPQFRSGLKVIARRFVPGAYQLIDIRTLKNPTQESINAQLEANRKTVNDIMETFIYTNPKDITPETIFGNEIIQHVFTTYFFGTGDNNRAFYFEGDEAVPLVTFALVVVAIFCGIEEWSTGRWENKQFTHKTYFNVYKSTLAGLNKWMAYSEKRVADGRTSTNATIAAQERLLRHARAVSYKPEDNADGKGARDMFSMDAMFAL